MTEAPPVAPPKKRRTWLWILLALMALFVIGMIAIAALGLFFVRSHVNVKPVTAVEAFREFDVARAPFKDSKPIFEIDAREHPKQIKKLNELPTSTKRAENMHIMIFDDDDGKLVNLSVPFWVLKMGKDKIDFSHNDFDWERLQLDVRELERVGPVLLLDYQVRGGQRVLIWTQ